MMGKSTTRRPRLRPDRPLAGALIGVFAGALLLALPAAAAVEAELAFHRGVVAYGEGRLDDARKQFQTVVEDDPTDAAALQYLGLIAHAEGDRPAAIASLRAAAEAAPEDPEIRIDLAAALLADDRTDEAEAELDRVIAAHPGQGRAHLYRGIADYRQRDYGAALPQFRMAEQLDPELRLESRYYVGLTEAFLGNLGASGDAFGDAVDESPNHPLGRSARALRVQIDPDAERKRWAAGVLTGLEFDSNPLVVGDDVFKDGDKVSGHEDPDGRGVLRLQGEVEPLRRENASLRVGYDGYFNFHFDETEVNQNTQVGWIATEALFDPIRVGLRYDYGYTWLDNDGFRSAHRVTPNVNLRNGDWGISQLFYEWQHLTYKGEIDGTINGKDANKALDRDGDQHTVGVNQFVFLPRPLSYVRGGFAFTHLDPEGPEFEHNGYEFSAGIAAILPLNIDAELLYRFVYRDYANHSVFDMSKKRNDYASRISLDLSIPCGDHWRASVAGSFVFNPSNVDFYDYDRQIVGMYLAYDF